MLEGKSSILIRRIDSAMLKTGPRWLQKEIEEMIWEVDENLDGCVDWDEFRLMYNRNVTDMTNLEPNQLFNIAQFLTYDKDFRGRVTGEYHTRSVPPSQDLECVLTLISLFSSVDDTMSMLYARYGRDKLESKVKEMFGHDLGNSNGDKDLTFLEYLDAVTKKELQKRMELKQKGKKKL